MIVIKGGKEGLNERKKGKKEEEKKRKGQCFMQLCI